MKETREAKARTVLRRAAGLPLFLAGLLLVGVEIFWTTSENRVLPLLPPLAADALMFLLGLTGLLLMYIGFRVVRSR